MSESPSSELAPSFTAEAARFREALTAGRSTVFLQLFDFLVARSGDERAPKEVEVALAIFGKDGSRDTVQDSAVRVYMHRLRKRLDDFYTGRPGPRLRIMKGEYRIVFSDEPSSVVGGTRWTWWSDRYRRRLLLWVGAFVLVLVLNSAAWLVVARRHPASAPAERRDVGAFWRPLSPVAPPLIVVGDSYLLAETDNQKDVKRLVLDPSIQSRDALGGYFTTHPSAFFQLYDLDLHYAPVDAAIAMWNVLPAVRALHRTDDAPRLISSSRLAAPDLDANDIVYVGRLSNLGILAMPLFRASDFRMGQSASELIEGPTNQRYAADAGAGRYQQSRIDYGYIASFPGPSGKRIILVSGLGDLGLQATAAMINDRAQLDALVKRIGAGRPFEALYEVRAMGTIVRDKSLVSAHPLRTSSMWDIRPARP